MGDLDPAAATAVVAGLDPIWAFWIWVFCVWICDEVWGEGEGWGVWEEWRRCGSRRNRIRIPWEQWIRIRQVSGWGESAREREREEETVQSSPSD